MTNKIIEAARSAGGTTYTNRHYPGETACAFGPEALARFYALARAEALEDAAQACRPFGKTGAVVAAAIKALKEQQHG